MKFCIVFLIRLYQYLLSPWVGRQCRFKPTCSDFSIEAIKKHGVRIGIFLMIRRIFSCHPWADGGIDPVPQKFRLFDYVKKLHEKFYINWIFLAIFFRSFF